ncbi:TrmH family RNA methyltransferase [Fodinibius sediminis]|uniref:RNA methyltransferase, TrmH family n=1 Tax=Fodinibius sediminis TaxID=1214077 RepID=A0A521D487_9BACT|nr:RNA methyltransferase [Fodinibius sediminis]SMO66487.1 RNA methyltransferase, TrmH family [Fodinibius sediminis]
MTYASNRQLTLLRKLGRKKYRHRERLFLIEGDRAVRQILKNKVVGIEALFFDDEQDYSAQEYWKALIETHESALLDNRHFAEISDTKHPQGVLALCRMPGETSVEKMGQGRRGIIVVLDAIQDPGNLGTIIRTASWFGAAGIVSGKGTVDLFHPKVVRSTAGATGVLPHLNGELPMVLADFEKMGWNILLLDKSEASVPLATVGRPEKTILVVGNEAHGIDPQLLGEKRVQVEIPPAEVQPKVESLNAAIAASIALYSLGC